MTTECSAPDGTSTIQLKGREKDKVTKPSKTHWCWDILGRDKPYRHGRIATPKRDIQAL